jgi:hypothetical protein
VIPPAVAVNPGQVPVPGQGPVAAGADFIKLADVGSSTMENVNVQNRDRHVA